MMLCTCGVAIGSSTYMDQCANFNETTQQCSQSILDIAWESAGEEFNVLRTDISVNKQTSIAYSDIGTDIMLYNIGEGTVSIDFNNPQHSFKITQAVGAGGYDYEEEVPFSVDTQFAYCYKNDGSGDTVLCRAFDSSGWLHTITLYVVGDYPSSTTHLFLYTTDQDPDGNSPFPELYQANQTLCNGCVSEYSDNKYPVRIQWDRGLQTYWGGDTSEYEWYLNFDTDFDLTSGDTGYYTYGYCSGYGTKRQMLTASKIFGVSGCTGSSFSNFDSISGNSLNSTAHMSAVLTGCNAFGLGAGTGSLYLDIYPNAIKGFLTVFASGAISNSFELNTFFDGDYTCSATNPQTKVYYGSSSMFSTSGEYKNYTSILFADNNTLLTDGYTLRTGCNFLYQDQCGGASVIYGMVGQAPFTGWADINSVYGRSGYVIGSDAYTQMKPYPDNPFPGDITIPFFVANGRENNFGAWSTVLDKAESYGQESGGIRILIAGGNLGYTCSAEDDVDYCSAVVSDPATGNFILTDNYNLKCESGYLGYDNYCGTFVSCQNCGSCIETRDDENMLTKVMCGTTCMGTPIGYYCNEDNNKYLNTTCGSSLIATCSSGKCENGECVGGVSGAITVVDTYGNWLSGTNVYLQSETDYFNVTGTTDANGMLRFNLPSDMYDITLTKLGFTTLDATVVVDSSYYAGCSPVYDNKITGTSCRFVLKSGTEANATSLRVIVMDETYTPLSGVTVNFTSPTQSFEGFTDLYGKYIATFDPANETVSITLDKSTFVPESDSVYLTTGQDILLTYTMVQVANITVSGNAGTGSRFMNGKAILSVTSPITGTMTVLRQDVIAYRCSDSTCTTYKPMTFFQPVWEPGSSPDDKGVSNRKSFGSKSIYDLFADSNAKYGLLGNIPAAVFVSTVGDLIGGSEIKSSTSPTFVDTNFVGRETETIDITIDGSVHQVKVMKNFRSNTTYICSMFGDSVNLMYPGGYNSFLTDYVIFDVNYNAYFADVLDSNTYSLDIDGATLIGTRTEIKTNPIFKPYIRRGYPSYSWMRGYEVDKFIRTLKAQRVTAGTTIKLQLMEYDVVGDIVSRLQKGDHSSIEPTANSKACASLTLDDSNFKVITYVTMLIEGDDGSKSIVTVPLESRVSNVNWFAPEKIMILGAIAGLVIPFVLAILLFVLFLILG
jgi:hypothetical protein